MKRVALFAWTMAFDVMALMRGAWRRGIWGKSCPQNRFILRCLPMPKFVQVYRVDSVEQASAHGRNVRCRSSSAAASQVENGHHRGPTDDMAHALNKLTASQVAAVVSNSKSSAKQALKFRPSYAGRGAYNALANLLSLECLIHLYAMFPQERPSLFTADKALALFWTGIQRRGFRMESDGLTFGLAPAEALLPGNTIKRWQEAIQAE